MKFSEIAQIINNIILKVKKCYDVYVYFHNGTSITLLVILVNFGAS